MRKLILLCASLCAMMLLFSESPARAQSVLWVASNGSDANVCSQVLPCLTFQGALNKGGVTQIRCLTSGNYGPVTITASLTIDCGTGNVGTVSITGSTNFAITINTTSAATIVLRHLNLNGNSSGGAGILTNSFASGTLLVQHCAIQNFGGSGIFFEPNAGRSMLQVSDSQVLNNEFGIWVQPINNQIATVTLNRIEVTGSVFNGLNLGGTGVVVGTMRHSVVGRNRGSGIATSGNQVFFTVEESSIVGNSAAGIAANSAGSVINVGASTIGANVTGITSPSGSLISFGNNQMSANATNGNFTGTTPLQ